MDHFESTTVRNEPHNAQITCVALMSPRPNQGWRRRLLHSKRPNACATSGAFDVMWFTDGGVVHDLYRACMNLHTVARHATPQACEGEPYAASDFLLGRRGGSVTSFLPLSDWRRRISLNSASLSWLN